MQNSSSQSRSTLRPVPWIVLAFFVGALLACEVDPGSSQPPPDAGPIPTEPREPDELPGSETEPGEDPCGTNASCHWDARGADTETPFVDDDISGAQIDENGAVTLDDSAAEYFFAWIPNSAEGTISRIDTEKRVEVGRYRTGPAGSILAPSRTAIRADGSVYVANADGESVTMIGLAPHCPTSGGDEMPTTSTGPDNLYDWGDDECVMWNTSLSGFGSVDAVAAQQKEGESFVWVGARDDSIWKLDGETGTVLFRTESPVRPNGFALDDDGNLWIAPYYEAELGRLDTTGCRDHGSCEVDICDAPSSDCIKERISAPGLGYGIDIDGEQRVWLGGDIMRYDPEADDGSRWVHVDPGVSVLGVVSDGDQWIFGAAGSHGLYRFVADNPDQSSAVSGTANRSVTAVDVDHHGYVWAINRDHNDAFVVEPGTGLFDGSIDDQVAGLDEPDAYSDMAGSVVRFDTDQLGLVRQKFEECDPTEHYHTEWQTLRFEVDADGGSMVRWRVRGAHSEAALDGAAWHDIGIVPPDTSPVDLRAILAEHDLARAGVVEVEAWLHPEYDGENFAVPRLTRMDVIADCPNIVL